MTVDGDGRSPVVGATVGQFLFLLLGLLLFVALFAVPLILLMWVGGAFYGSFGVAEMLERTHGLAPSTYERAFRLAVIFTGLMALIEIGASFRKAAGERGLFARLLTRPATGLLLLFVPTIFLVRIDTRGTDVPDLLTTALLLCCLGYVYFILPLALLSTSWRLTRWAWRKGRRSGFASGILGTLGIVFASCVPVLCVARDDDSGAPVDRKLGESFQRGLAKARGNDAVPGSLAFLAELAAAFPTPPEAGHGPPGETSWPGEGSKDRFDECIESLSQAAGGKSTRDETVRDFVGRGTAHDVAEQIVQETLLELCLGHARKPFTDLVQRFRWLSKNRRKNNWRRQSNWNACTLTVEQHFYGYEPPTPEDQVDFLALNRVLCSLEDPRDHQILRLWAAGVELDTIGSMLDPPMKPATVRQHKKRALEALRAHLH
jgi:DNA-directed RNA polymerase specialized sigma24 family protein